jgi:hypothetical protein
MREAWILGDLSARLETDLLQGAIDLAHPERGLTSLAFGGRSLDTSVELLAAELGPPGDSARKLADAYVRGADLVASYASTDCRPIGVQIYWRAHADSAARMAAVDLEVSVQTQLLDSDPTLTTVSRVPAGDVVAIGADGPSICWLLRPGGAEWSYVEMVHSHACDSEIGTVANVSSLRHRLFAERLEKGVILRTRVRGVFLDRKQDVERARTAYQEFLAAPPSLTT